MTTQKDYTGARFERIVVLSDDPSQGCKRKVACRCDCGKQKDILIQALTNGRTSSCGCLRKEKAHAYNTGFFGRKRA